MIRSTISRFVSKLVRGRKATKKIRTTRKSDTVRFGISYFGLEDRITPTGSYLAEPGYHPTTQVKADSFAVVQRVDTPATPVFQGESNVLIQKISLTPQFNFIPLDLEDISFYGVGRNSDLAHNVSTFYLKADLNDNMADGYETTIASTSNFTHNNVMFAAGDTYFDATVNMAVFADIKNDAPGKYVAMDVTKADFSVYGRVTPQANVAYPYGGRIGFHTVQAVQQADLSSMLSIENSNPVTQGTAVTFYLTVINSGPNAAQNVTATGGFFPVQSFTFVPNGSGSMVVDQVVNGVHIPTVFLGSLAANQATAVAFTFIATASGGYTVGSNVSSSTLDPNPANNSSPLSFTVATPTKADLSVGLTAYDYQDQTTTVGSGQLVSYKFRLTNTGPNPAQTVFTEATLPGNWTFMTSLSDPEVGDFNFGDNKNSVQIILQALQPGETRVYNAVFRTGGLATTVVTTATITSDTNDPNLANNRSDPVTINVVAGKLYVTGKATGTTETAVSNTKNIVLDRFETRADKADLLLTKFVFAAQTGDVLNAQDYSLWCDTNFDGAVDTILQSGVASQNGEVIFDDLTAGGFVDPRDQTDTYEVHGDVVSSINMNNPTLQLQFATSDPGYVQSESVVTGESLVGIATNGVGNGDITVTTVTPKIWNLVKQGDLFVVQDTVSIRPQQLLGGTLTSPVFRLQFTSRNEAIDITAIQLTSLESTAVSVDRIRLFLEGATAPFAEATNPGADVTYSSTHPGTRTFEARMPNHQLIIPKNSDVKVLVEEVMNADTDGAISGEPNRLFVWGDPTINYSTGQGAVRAHGVDSSNDELGNVGGTAIGAVHIGTNSIGTSNVDITGVRHVSVLSKLASIVNASPVADGSPIPLGSPTDMGTFKFTAAANNNTLNGINKVKLRSLIVNVNFTGVTVDTTSFQIYNDLDSSTYASGFLYDAAGQVVTTPTFTGQGFIRFDNFDANINSRIDPGSSITLAVRGKALSALTVYTAQVSLQNITSPTLSPYGFNGSHVVWDDVDSVSGFTYGWFDLGGVSTIGSVIFRN